MKEEYIEWKPVILPKGKYINSLVVQDLNGTTIVLDNEIYKVEIVFDGFIHALLCSDEGCRLNTLGSIRNKYGKDYIAKNMLFEVHNSSLSKWIVTESCKIYQEHNLKHYCIITDDDVIDVIASYEPNVYISKLL